MKKKLFSLLVVFCLFFATMGVGAALTSQELATLFTIRSVAYGGTGLYMATELITISGEQYPIFPYDADDRAIITWKIKDKDADDFAAAIGLPPWMSLAKVSPIVEKQCKEHKCKKQEKHKKKHFYMIADIANTERYVQGAKVEWKTFVTVGADPTPRVLRFDSQDANVGVDLIDVYTTPFGLVEWGIEDNVASGLITNGVHTLDITIPIKQGKNGEPRIEKNKRFTQEFAIAGEHVYTPTGSNSKYYFDETLVSTELLSIEKKGVSIVNTFPWAEFVGKVDDVIMPVDKTEQLVQPIGVPVDLNSYEAGLYGLLLGMALDPQNPAPPEVVFGTLMSDPMVNPMYLPTMFYGLSDLYQSLMIYAGLELPKMTFYLKDDPKAIFLNFEIPEENVEAFEEAFLPEGFELAKMRFYPEQKEEIYAVSLNLYECTGTGIAGFRAEWDSYVINPNDEDPRPRFIIIEAQTSGFGFDSMYALEHFDPADPTNWENIREDPSDVFEYTASEEDGFVATIVDVEEDIYLDVNVSYPDEEDVLYTVALPYWMESNDDTYWSNGVAEIVKYNSGIVFPELMVFKPEPGTISDTTFEGYVNPEPFEVIIWGGTQDVALEPWGNLESIIPSDAGSGDGDGSGDSDDNGGPGDGDDDDNGGDIPN